MKKKTLFILFTCVFYLLFSCKKDKTSVGNTPVVPIDSVSGHEIYADSVFYIQPQDLTVKPQNKKAGTYTAIPEGLKIDASTGEIDVNKSETGLKYKVTFTPDNGLAQTSNCCYFRYKLRRQNL